MAQREVLQEARCLENEGVHLEFRQRELSTVHHRRHQSRLQVGLGPIEPRMLFQSPQARASTRAPGAAAIIPQLTQGVALPNVVQPQIQQPPTQQQIQQPPALPQYQTQQPAQPERFHTSAGHYSNPIDNVLAATHNLAMIPINGNSPLEIEARKGIDMLKTSVTQQANYSNMTNRLPSTPYNSRSGRNRHGDSPAPAESSNAWRQRERQNQ